MSRVGVAEGIGFQLDQRRHLPSLIFGKSGKQRGGGFRVKGFAHTRVGAAMAVAVPGPDGHRQLFSDLRFFGRAGQGNARQMLDALLARIRSFGRAHGIGNVSGKVDVPPA